MGEGGWFGWGRVEGWGENADNCNGITRKEKKRKKKVVPSFIADLRECEIDTIHKNNVITTTTGY